MPTNQRLPKVACPTPGCRILKSPQAATCARCARKRWSGVFRAECDYARTHAEASHRGSKL